MLLWAIGQPWAYGGNYRGTFAWGHEVQSFEPCGSKKAYWVVGDENILQSLRDHTERLRIQRGKPYQPIYIEAVGLIDTKSKRDGFDNNYDGLFRLHKITKVSDIVPKGCEK